ncbi:inovirus Gp2 family protein [Vibrio coralliirubri]|uniref:inovirus Gp2 family protein n=1 Tax=Vibrio coralliirubri TaxID=1516159 RepID=UPI00073E4A03|nr:inovirus Gp2 family protein [Vibrio coralliirubri]MCY9863346.1 inovirus Gp2 family protein [Vibrio coralliirubri]
MNMFQLAHIPAKYGSLNQHHLARINDTVMGALALHPRTLIARVDLRILNNGGYSDNPLERDVPTCFVNIGVGLMKRFLASLNAQIATDQMNKAKQGKRIHPCPLNYVWVRERSTSHNEHYHVALVVNQDAYYPLGKLHYEGTLACMVNKAWASALGLTVDEIEGLVHIPERPMYTLNRNHPPARFQKNLDEAAVRLAYLAKAETKILGDGRRNFGCSNPRKGLI